MLDWVKHQASAIAQHAAPEWWRDLFGWMAVWSSWFFGIFPDITSWADLNAAAAFFGTLVFVILRIRNEIKKGRGDGDNSK